MKKLNFQKKTLKPTCILLTEEIDKALRELAGRTPGTSLSHVVRSIILAYLEERSG